MQDGPIVLHGKSNTGKTAFAVAHFENPLILKRRDDLKSISPMTDGLIFDDMSFTDWSAEEVIALLDFEITRSISGRYADATIERDMPMILTTNKRMDDDESIFPRPTCGEQRAAIKRRYEAIEITGPLMITGAPLTKAEKKQRREDQAEAQKKALADAAAAAWADQDDEDSPVQPRQRRRLSVGSIAPATPSTGGSIIVQSDELHVHVHDDDDW